MSLFLIVHSVCLHACQGLRYNSSFLGNVQCTEYYVDEQYARNNVHGESDLYWICVCSNINVSVMHQSSVVILYIYIYIYIYTHTHTHIHTYIHTYMSYVMCNHIFPFRACLIREEVQMVP